VRQGCVGRAWAEFCDALKAAGDLVQERATCDLDRIEGYRYLSRLARDGLYSSIGLRWNQAVEDVEPEVRVIAVGT